MITSKLQYTFGMIGLSNYGSNFSKNEIEVGSNGRNQCNEVASPGDLPKSNVTSEYLFILEVNSRWKSKKVKRTITRYRSFFYMYYRNFSQFFNTFIFVSKNIVYIHWLSSLFIKFNNMSPPLVYNNSQVD